MMEDFFSGVYNYVLHNQNKALKVSLGYRWVFDH